MQRKRVVAIGVAVVALAGAGFALASGSGSGDSAPATQPVAPNGGSASGLPQREVAVQPQLARPTKK